METQQVTREAKAQINTAALEALIESHIPVAILDARAGTSSDDGERIAGGKGMHPQAGPQKAASLIPSKNALVVTYCGGLKCPLSSQLAEHLNSMGYANVLVYPEGISGWRSAGNTVEKTG